MNNGLQLLSVILILWLAIQIPTAALVDRIIRRANQRKATQHANHQ